MNEPQFIRSSALHVVEVSEGSHDARSKSTQLGTDVRRTEIDSTESTHTDPSPELKPLSLDHSSTISGSTPHDLDQFEGSPNPQPNTNASPAVPASTAMGAHTSDPAPRRGQAQSHFSDQISELKAANNHVRAELKRRESASSNQT